MHADKQKSVSLQPTTRTDTTQDQDTMFFFLSLQCAWVRVNGLPMEVVARYRGNRICFCLMSTHCYEIKHFSGSSL